VTTSLMITVLHIYWAECAAENC